MSQHRPIDDPDATEIAVELAPQLESWRGIKIEDADRQRIDEVTVSGGRRTASTRVDAASLLQPGGHLLFKKGKGPGIRSGLHRVPTGGHVEQFNGMRVGFLWS